MHKIIICTYDENLIPIKKTDGSVCRDLKIASDFTLGAGEYGTIGTGIKTYIPIGRHAKIYARSGLPGKMGLMKANNIAIIDADYRGEYILQFYNFTKQESSIEKYSRLSQMEFAPYYINSGEYGKLEAPELEIIVDSKIYEKFAELYPTERGEGRFNSTGHK